MCKHNACLYMYHFVFYNTCYVDVFQILASCEIFECSYILAENGIQLISEATESTDDGDGTNDDGHNVHPSTTPPSLSTQVSVAHAF